MCGSFRKFQITYDFGNKAFTFPGHFRPKLKIGGRDLVFGRSFIRFLKSRRMLVIKPLSLKVQFGRTIFLLFKLRRTICKSRSPLQGEGVWVWDAGYCSNLFLIFSLCWGVKQWPINFSVLRILKLKCNLSIAILIHSEPPLSSLIGTINTLGGSWENLTCFFWLILQHRQQHKQQYMNAVGSVGGINKSPDNTRYIHSMSYSGNEGFTSSAPLFMHTPPFL